MATWHQSHNRTGLAALYRSEPGVWKVISDKPDEFASAIAFNNPEDATALAAKNGGLIVTPLAKPEDTPACKFTVLEQHDWHGRRGYVGINESQRLYVIPADGGFSCLGFDVAERKRQAVLKWLAKGALTVTVGTALAYEAYLEAMEAGRRYSERSGLKCLANLTPALTGLEGRRVALVDKSGQEIERFYVSRSGGWMPVHIALKRRNSSGGCAVYMPDGATVRTI
ncbi:hypothetical protein HDIA_0725 [Hartmannibacter diazotrophicus]|uniref:Uncharacterized protein n=1 Tax=Hartmannibacter diazotrophicus TaxID=1482074 RepID=A0A2C9D1Z0_9HYPH|nr:hypothetical protein [Hartmannibacter diazotrophicus]SON54266.1 hypothetical protein HDIA_0725 [Hartmannibacter diazotrophicus]